MTETQMTALACDVYAAFNAKTPSQRSCQIWAMDCSHIPEQSIRWIFDMLRKREYPPRQFGQAVLDLYADWKSERGVKQGKREPCSNCDEEMPGFFFGWKAFEGQVYKLTFRCPCNQDKAWQHLPCKHKKQVHLEGYEVMPQGYRKGSGIFEAELLGYKKGKIDKQKIIQTLRNAQAEKPRLDHKRQLQENELW